jgi:hypothetical protein
MNSATTMSHRRAGTRLFYHKIAGRPSERRRDLTTERVYK